MVLESFTPGLLPKPETADEFVSFLSTHLEQYGDPPDHIRMAIDYALSDEVGKGGFVISARENGHLVGVVVVNKTGMEGYIPENILVYIAVRADTRGKGLGKMLMQKVLDTAEGAIALHVEPENPAAVLYRKLGFTSKYLEMRYSPQ